ncbi:glycosyltransferase [Paenibacillus naphthalenovorans]|uniref:glycosyltransferase n=1 Tax=Paenibacillus naphthalenovorans TaxID=162209 RepID=UPI000888EE9F|nr:glycosyltransferase [Paenibacillus naphthalenovorans]SDJ12747.1 Methyltransferase domain-containing protein [Paenibacillus naphthalenovorans]
MSDNSKELLEKVKLMKSKIEELIHLGELETASQAIDKCEELVPEDAELLSMKAIVLMVEGKWTDAKTVLMKGLDIDPYHTDLLYNQAYWYEQQQDYQSAYDIYCDLKQLLPAGQEQEIRSKMTQLKELDPNIRDKKKLVFFVKEKMDNFINDIIHQLSAEYRTKKIVVTHYPQIDDGMKWADICWFEWCDELIIYGSKLQMAQDKKIICRLHSYEAFTNYPKQVNWASVDHVIFVAEHIKQFVLEQVGQLKQEQTCVIPSGIDLSKFEFKERQAGFNIAYAGFINYKKGPVLLLHFFHKLYTSDNRYKLFIAGEFQEPRYALYFRQMINELGLQHNIIFDGWVKDINQWLEDKHYIVSTSLLESQNLSVMEAMAKGIKPLVHNFVGARNIYDSKFIWNTIDDGMEMVVNEQYDSKQYRDFIKSRYTFDQQMSAIAALLQTQKNTKVGKFDYAAYWNNRLNQRFNVEGVGYLGLGEIYNRYMYQIRLDILNYLFNQIFDNFKNASVLELGPGIGMFTQFFATQKPGYYKAIDIAKKSIIELEKKYDQFEFIEGDISIAANYETNRYDLVFAADVLLHLTDEEKYRSAISNISSSLKNTGYAVLFDPISMIGTQSESPHVVIRDISYVNNVLDSAGLEIVSVLPVSFFMNYPFDRKMLKDNGQIVKEMFDYIQAVFSSKDLSDETKNLCASWLISVEKNLLADKRFGLSQKALLIKKKSNPRIITASIHEVWNMDQVKEDNRLARNAVAKNEQLNQYGVISKFDHFIRQLSELRLDQR